eukprot:scaffold33632_cov135-Isochrysis_galbana.AAC.7
MDTSMFAVGWSRSCPAAVHSAVGHSRRQATRRLASSRPRRHFPRSAGCALACSQMRRSFMCADHRMVLSPHHAWELPLSAGVPCRDIMARFGPFWHRLGLPRASPLSHGARFPARPLQVILLTSSSCRHVFNQCRGPHPSLLCVRV